MIDRDHKLSITRQARLLEISRGTVYYLPRSVSPADLALMRKLDELHLKHPFMGARMLRDQLARQGIDAGRRHIRTLMLRMGIEALVPQPGTSQAAPGHKIYPYLLRKLVITRANQVWALDTTYIPMARGFVYLTAVVDVASRKVLSAQGGDHAGSGSRQGGDRAGLCPVRCARDRQHGPGQPVHGRGVHRGRLGPRLQVVHGRARRLA